MDIKISLLIRQVGITSRQLRRDKALGNKMPKSKLPYQTQILAIITQNSSILCYYASTTQLCAAVVGASQSALRPRDMARRGDLSPSPEPYALGKSAWLTFCPAGMLPYQLRQLKMAAFQNDHPTQEESIQYASFFLNSLCLIREILISRSCPGFTIRFQPVTMHWVVCKAVSVQILMSFQGKYSFLQG